MAKKILRGIFGVIFLGFFILVCHSDGISKETAEEYRLTKELFPNTEIRIVGDEVYILS